MRTVSSGRSSGFTLPRSFQAPALASRQYNESSTGTAGRFGRKQKWKRARRFTLLCEEINAIERRGERIMASKTILLVEDNADDEALTFRALMKNNIANNLVVARDGAEALDYLFGTGQYAGRDVNLAPQVVLLDLNLPKISGLEVLRQLRANERTKHLPVVILTSSNEEQDRLRGYDNGANSYVRKPVDFNQFIESVRQLGLYWLILNEQPPARR
jgi:CheY-like chemotaxis protein